MNNTSHAPMEPEPQLQKTEAGVEPLIMALIAVATEADCFGREATKYAEANEWLYGELKRRWQAFRNLPRMFARSKLGADEAEAVEAYVMLTLQAADLEHAGAP